MGRSSIPPRAKTTPEQPQRWAPPDPGLVVALLAFLGLLGWALYTVYEQGFLQLF
jgi:hypothetical protein